VNAANADVAETATQQMIVAQAAYHDWLSSRERIRLVRETLEFANAAVSAAHSRLKAGDLSAQDALRIEIDAKRVEADLQSARLDVERSEIALGQFVDRNLLARSRDEPVVWPPQRSFVGGNVAKSIGAEQRPDVRAAKSRIEAATASLDGARALAKADPTWGVSFDHYPGTSSRLLELRVQIPLTFGYRFEGEIARAQSELAQSELVAERVARDAQAELNRLEAEAASTASRASQFDADIVPRATTVLRQAEFAYARGALSLTDLLDARRTQRATQMDALSARTDAAKANAALMLRTQPETQIQ
jgi:cobalt-zinc-cadmium efflux system outer membrane protein